MVTGDNSLQYYSQVTVAAMSLKLEEQADEILHLRDETTRWRTWYAQLTPQPEPPAVPLAAEPGIDERSRLGLTAWDTEEGGSQ